MNKKLFAVKLAHTVIWAIFVLVILYIVYCGVFDCVNIAAFVGIGLVIGEGIVLLICGWRCPLTLLGRKYTDEHEVGFDIFLPTWLAKNNKVIFTTLFVIGVVLVIYRLLT